MPVAYGIGGIFTVLPAAISQNNPPPASFRADLGQEYFDKSTTPPTLYIYNGQTWVNPALNSTGGSFTSLTVTPGPVSLTGTTTINTTGSATTTIGTGGTGAVAIGNATGNTAVTGALSTTTTLTATLGNITATNGNFVGSTAGTGLQFNANTATGAAASPIVINSRAGQAIFTSVSIAAAADLTLTITNSAITASTTQVIYSMSGSTTGSALSIKSVTNSSGSSAIVVTNGTGATTSTSNITLNFIVVN